MKIRLEKMFLSTSEDCEYHKKKSSIFSKSNFQIVEVYHMQSDQN